MEKNIFKKTNLQWLMDYDYERSRCHCGAFRRGDYCRCTKIEHAWIDEIHVYKVISELYNKYSKTDSDVDKYCFDRICTAFKIYDKNYYEIEVSAGYYGEEIDGIYFNNEEKLIKAYYGLCSLDIEKVKYCLKLEYSYLIDSVDKATDAYFMTAAPADIHLPQTEYFIKLEHNVIEGYKNRELAVAVCIKDGNKYRLIDGYHRFIANKERDFVDIIVLE